MFSSSQDLVDIIYLIPVGIIIGILLYLFPIAIPLHYLSEIHRVMLFFIITIQPALLFSIAFHAILVLVLSRLK